MQIERRQISLFTGTFAWVILLAIGNMVKLSITLTEKQNTIFTVVYAVVLVLALIVIYFLTRKLTLDEKVPITKRDTLLFKIISYSIVIVFILSLILTNGNFIHNRNVILGFGYGLNALNIVLSIIGIVYTSIILVKNKERPNPPKKQTKVVEAEFEEKDDQVQ